MERDNPLDDLSDERLLELFRSVDGPSPPPDFALRTMRAVMRDPVPAGRKALRDPLTSMFGWAAVIAAVALSVLALALTQPIVAASFSRLITLGVGTGVWLMQFTQTAVRVLDLLTTTGVAVSRAMVTAEGTHGLAADGRRGRAVALGAAPVVDIEKRGTRMARTFIAAATLLMLAVIAASAQSNVDELRKRLEARFEIVPIANGMVLTPRFKTSIRSIELSDSTIAIDGAPVTGRELSDRLGPADTDMVLQLSYLDSTARRVAGGRQNASCETGRRDSADARSRFHGPHGARGPSHTSRTTARSHRAHRRQRLRSIATNTCAAMSSSSAEAQTSTAK